MSAPPQMSTQFDELVPDVKRNITKYLQQIDLQNFSLTSIDNQSVSQAAKKEWLTFEKLCRSWEYTGDLTFPKLYLGTVPNKYRRPYDAGKLRLIIQERSLLVDGDPASSVISIDYNPMIVDQFDLDMMRFNGIPMKFNFNGINTNGVQRIVIGNPLAFKMILKKCKLILTNLMSSTTSIWNESDEMDLRLEREEYGNIKIIPFPGYKDDSTIEANKARLIEIYEGLVQIIDNKLSEYPPGPPKKGGNKKIKKK